MSQEKARTLTSTTGVGRVGVGQVSSSSDVILSKMINDRQNNVFSSPATGFYASDSLLDITAERQATNIDDYENILKTQPELELPIQILISSILSPKTANKITLKHSLKKNGLPVAMAKDLLQSAKNCVDNVYNIKAGLAEKLRKALFTHGASVTIIMGEAAIDDVINGRLKGLGMASESLKAKYISETLADSVKPMGYLGGLQKTGEGTTGQKSMGMESLMNEAANIKAIDKHAPMDLGEFLNIKGFVAPEIIDNPAILGLNMALEGMMDEKRKKLSQLATGGSIEDIDSLYHDMKGGQEEMVIFPRPEEASRKSRARPTRREVGLESCTVIFQTGNPKKHLGYMFLMDEFGGFASRDMRRDYWRNVSEMVGGNRETVSSVLDRAAKATNTDNSNDMMLAMAAASQFREMALQDIERRLINGSVGNGTIGQEDAFFNLMFERAIAGRQTRVLYVPADMVSYWAYRYNTNGTGRSMLEDNKFLAGVRSMLTVANTETALRNSIDYTKLQITLDPNDPNKSKTKELIIDQYVRNRLRSTPWNVTNPRRIVEMMQMAGVSVDIDGGDNYPGTKVAITRDDIQQREVNMELDESIFRRIMMGFGVAPEIVDLSMQIEFSSKIITSNELSLKRVMVIQDVTNYLTRQEAIKTFLSDPIQMDEFEEIVKRHIAAMEMSNEDKAKIDVRRVINIFLGAYDINLPRPENGLDADIAEFNSYMEGVDKVLETAFSNEANSDQDENALKTEYDRIKAVVRQYKAIQWMVEHDFMTEVLDDLKGTPEGELADIVTASVMHSRSINGLIKAISPRLKAQNVVDSEQLQALFDNLDQFRDKTQASGGGGGDSYDSNTEGEDGPIGGDDSLNSDAPDDLLGDLGTGSTEEPEETPPADAPEPGNGDGAPGEEEPET